QIGDGGHGVDGALEEAAGYSHKVARQKHVEDLPLAVAQKLVAHGVAVLQETELAKLVTIDDEVAPAFDRHLIFDQGFQTLQIISTDYDVWKQPHDKRMLLQFPGRSCVHGFPGGKGYH